jgi:hypothetical protein
MEVTERDSIEHFFRFIRLWTDIKPNIGYYDIIISSS